MKEKVFISSVQKEFSQERFALADYFRTDALLSTFFEPFLFEEVAATSYSPREVFLPEVESSHIYLGLIGKNYGWEDEEGISPTEREYDAAKQAQLARWLFIKEETFRHKKEEAFLKKISGDVSWKIFHNLENLKQELYKTCITYLKQQGKITSSEFDESIRQEATLEDIDDLLSREFIEKARSKRNFPLAIEASKSELLTHLNMLRKEGLVNSAFLVFSKNPQYFFPTAIIKCAHFHGITVQKPIPDFKEFSGNIFNQADQAVDFVLSKISLSTGTREHSNYVETKYEVPRKVIAEAIINALAHRDYHSKGSVQVSVFKNRIEISNPGTLPDELELNDLKTIHGSYPKNPLLANCLYLNGAIERFGTGTTEIFQLTEAEGLKTPEFTLNQGFKVTLWRPSFTEQTNSFELTPQATPQANPQANPQAYLNDLDPTARLVINLTEESTTSQLQDKLELKDRKYFRETFLNPAIKRGYIEPTIPDKPTSPNQKYRLTQKGKQLQMELIKP